MACSSLERAWPLDRADYLCVCDEHPQYYHSSAAALAALGEDEEPVLAEPFNRPRFGVADFRLVAASPRLLQWVSLKQLADFMEVTPREVACLAKHLKNAVEAGLLTREQRRQLVNGRPVLRWFYRRSGERWGRARPGVSRWL